LRFATLNPNNPFGEGPLKNWFHIKCFCESKANKTKIEKATTNDINGWDSLSTGDKKSVLANIPVKQGDETKPSTSKKDGISSSKDNQFSEFNKLIDKIADEPSYNNKSAIIQRYLREGSSKKKFEGNLELWLKLLMPKIDQRVYNLQDKQIIKLFSKIFGCDHQDLVEDLYAGDVSETIAKFFKESRAIKPVGESKLTLADVDDFLNELESKTREEQFEAFCKKCTVSDIRTLIRLIKKDLKMNCRERHVLDALHAEAYECFQKSRDLKLIIKQYGFSSTSSSAASTSKTKMGLNVMTAVSPMLAEACKDFDKALKKCPEGFYSEIKYDGERVQIHKQGDDFKFFSRNLKPVMEHKISKLKDYLPKAFPDAHDLILDSEIIMVDTTTGDLLPFGTLGKHKKEELQNASTCLFVFDCLLFNGEDLTKKTLKDRKTFLESNITPIKHHVELSEYKLLKKKNELVEMTKDVLKKGLEGLVLKGLNSVYEPGKRRWLKVKKDYLLEGKIADSCDLVVLGAYYGTGKMGSRYSIFLMGCLDEKTKVWKTVTKVHSGLDDITMERVHKQLTPLVEPWSVNKKLPEWVRIDRTLIPDVLAKDPFKMPVFEVVAAEFTNSDVHTSNSISMRFPRIAKIRKDKSPKEATNLEELIHLYEESKSGMKIDELNKLKNDSQPTDTSESKALVSKKDLSSSSLSGAIKRKADMDNANIDKCDDNDNELAPKKKTKNSKVEEDEVESGIFKGFILFDNNCESSELKDFKKRGGRVTEKSTEANLVLHDAAEISDELKKLRKQFAPTCRHYQKSWLTESLETDKIANPLKHFVKLRQK
jgi:DNA ligase-3